MHWRSLMASLAQDLHPEVVMLPSPGGCRRLRATPAWSAPLDRAVVRAALGIGCGVTAPPRCAHRHQAG